MPNKEATPSNWTMAEIQETVGGHWHHPLVGDRRAKRFAVGTQGVTGYKEVMFIAMDTQTWLAGSKNTGLYGFWNDTHALLPKFQGKVSGFIVQTPSDELPEDIPQLVVENTYDCINKLADAAIRDYEGKVVAITGTVGKSTTKGMLEHILRPDHSLAVTTGNHNSRTGVMLAMSSLKSQPEFCLLEVALTALWMRGGDISKRLRPHICIITQIGVTGQSGAIQSLRATVQHKSRVCESIQPGGRAVIYGGMDELDFVIEQVVAYGATPVLYGEDVAFDSALLSYEATRKGALIRARILGEEVRYTLSALGKAMAYNSLAALTAAKLLELDIQKLSGRFANFPRHKSVFEFIDVDTGTGTVTIVDDTHNAEVVSMLAAVNAIGEVNKEGRREIAILGDIINLGDLAPSLHAGMAPSFTASKVDTFFAHSENMEYLLGELPQERVGGLFHSAETLVDSVARYIQDGDLILIKGDRRDTDFNEVPVLLRKALHHKNMPGYRWKSGPGAALYTLEGGIVLQTQGDQDAFVHNEGLGAALLVYHALKCVYEGTISLQDTVTVNSAPTNAVRSGLSIGLKPGDTVTCGELLNAVILNMAPDASIILADYIGGKLGGSTLKRLRGTAKSIGLTPEAVNNVTGRTRTSAYQQYTLDDVRKVAGLLFSLPAPVLSLLREPGLEYNGKSFPRGDRVDGLPACHCTLSFGYGAYSSVSLGRKDGKTVIACVCNAKLPFHRDYLAAQLLEKPKALQAGPPIPIESKTDIITFCGDTYFGEWYTQRRIKAGEKDALSEYGYGYSFETVAPFLQQSDYNIVNFEGVLTRARDSALEDKLTFVLKGDPYETVKELQRRNVHAVTLANNHSMDYGEQGMLDTIKAFESAGIRVFGAGASACQAAQALEVESNGRHIIILSAYWMRRVRHVYGYYAVGSHGGATALWDNFLDTIAGYRAEHPKATIISIVHWGEDFSFLLERLRPQAEKMVLRGADMIVGHGTHTIAPVEFIQGKPVVYSLGNFVFNSNGGDFIKKKIPPYGFVARLSLHEGGDALRLYPIYVMNLKTFWQPRPVTESQYRRISTFLGSKNEKIQGDQDGLGFYFEIKL